MKWYFLLWTIFFLGAFFGFTLCQTYKSGAVSSSPALTVHARWQCSNSLWQWVWRWFCMQVNIYGFVSCWHYRKRLKMAKRALADDECLFLHPENRVMIQGTELQYGLPVAGLSWSRTFPKRRNSWFCSISGSNVAKDHEHFTWSCCLPQYVLCPPTALSVQFIFLSSSLIHLKIRVINEAHVFVSTLLWLHDSESIDQHLGLSVNIYFGAVRQS